MQNCVNCGHVVVAFPRSIGISGFENNISPVFFCGSDILANVGKKRGSVEGGGYSVTSEYTLCETNFISEVPFYFYHSDFISSIQFY